MAYQNKLLFRDDTNDDGSTPSHGGTYQSPDIISHDQIADPQTELSGSYARDVNQQVSSGSKTNFVYTRVKSLDSTPQEVYLRLYRAGVSLFMTPSVWRGNAMKTPAGDPFVKVSATSKGDVAVGVTPFVLDATASNRFCLVGIANTDRTETVPEDFRTYDEFVVWVHQNPGVCVRNLNVIGTTKTNYEQLDGLKNPEDTPRHAAFYLTATNVPVGTTIGMQCEPAKLEASVVTSSETETLSAAVPAVPPHFDGFVRVWAVLPPSEPSWPDDARLDLDYGVEMAPSMQSHQWGVHPREVLCAADASLFNSVFRLVMVGSCGTIFKSA